jgi:hypothetical protein
MFQRSDMAALDLTDE